MGSSKVPKPTVIPTKDDSAVEEAARQRKLQMLSGGRAQTVLTSNKGVTEDGAVGKSTLGRG